MKNDEELTATEYEALTKSLVDLVSKRAPVKTLRVQHDVVLEGKATRNQVDVLWDFETSGSQRRVLFECRNYKRPIVQGAVHAFRSVVADIDTAAVPCTGVIVTRTGYQSGAKKVASTYGIIVLELRHPDEEDLAHRLTAIRVTMIPRLPVFEHVRLHMTEDYAGATGTIVAPNQDLQILEEGKPPLTVLEILLGDVDLNDLDEDPTPDRHVQHVFNPPASLLVEGRSEGRVQALSGTVGERDAEPNEFVVGGLDSLAWMVKETMGGARAWFMEDGRMFVTPE